MSRYHCLQVSFADSLNIQEIDDENWLLLSPFRVHAVRDDTETVNITVPQLFRTDFASVPRLPLMYAAFGNRAHRPAVVHDYLYSVGGTEDDRYWADQVFRAAMLAEGMPAADVETMYLAVREFGASHWSGE